MAKVKEKPRVKFNELGEEIPDSTPSSIQVGYHIPKNWKLSITELVRKALNDQAESQGYETFDEANDFDCPEEEEDMALTPYEDHFDHEENFVKDVESYAEARLNEEKEKDSGNRKEDSSDGSSVKGSNRKFKNVGNARKGKSAPNGAQPDPKDLELNEAQSDS